MTVISDQEYIQRLTEQNYQLTHEINALRNNESCLWDLTDDGYYLTGCNESFTLTEGTPEENHYKYCPGCGMKIEVVEKCKYCGGSGMRLEGDVEVPCSECYPQEPE